MLVLLDMHAFMRADALQFLCRYGKYDVAEDYATKAQIGGDLAAARARLAIRYFYRPTRHDRFATEYEYAAGE